jgi:glycosyltransferase involved in cell wall biosynthesis
LINHPKVTIAILSWNRLHYLKATVESAKRCIQYPNMEWIISDNESEEPGLRNYLESLDWVDLCVFKKQSHADAMNQIVDMASGEYLLLWPEDVQFIIEGDWMIDMVDVMQRHTFIGSMGLDAMRRQTLIQLLATPWHRRVPALIREIYWYRTHFRRKRVLMSKGSLCYRTMGWGYPGVCGSGIPSLTRTAVWRALGPWKMKWGNASNLVDSSLGAEEDMYDRFYLSRLPLQTAIPFIPVAADIITDPLGCKAKVRKEFRYGVYMPPQQGQTYYYRIRSIEEFRIDGRPEPLSFGDIVEPIGFRIPVDRYGDRLKFPINDSIQYDILKGQSVEFPLRTDPSQSL